MDASWLAAIAASRERHASRCIGVDRGRRCTFALPLTISTLPAISRDGWFPGYFCSAIWHERLLAAPLILSLAVSADRAMNRIRQRITIFIEFGTVRETICHSHGAILGGLATARSHYRPGISGLTADIVRRRPATPVPAVICRWAWSAAALLLCSAEWPASYVPDGAVFSLLPVTARRKPRGTAGRGMHVRSSDHAAVFCSWVRRLPHAFDDAPSGGPRQVTRSWRGESADYITRE